MPLVVPGITNADDSKQSEWMNKLVGKKISEDKTDVNFFAKKDLPTEHRIIEPGSMSTMDMNPNRMNIHVGEDGTVQKVDFK
ncbi:hypothetical protein MMC25_005165 [Agyrium rufum]|nr:hypothetical protein [Agyrium rufum]